MSILPVPVNAAELSKNDVAKARKELEAYKKTLLDTPEIAALNNGIKTLENTLKSKSAELKAITDKMLDKNPEYTAKVQALSAAKTEEEAFKKKVMSDPQIKELQDVIKKTRDEVTSEKKKLQELTNGTLKADAKYAEMEAAVKEMGQKSAGSPAAKPAPKQADMAPAKSGGMPQRSPFGADGQAKSAQGGQGTPSDADPGVEIDKLISQYAQSKDMIETIGNKLGAVLNTLPPESEPYRKAKNGLSKIGAPKLNPALFK